MITSQLNYESLGRTFIKSSRTLKYYHSFHHGHRLFDELAQRTNVSPHHFMLKCLHQNRQSEALGIFKKHVKLGLSNIDEVAIAVALKACRRQPKLGYQIHGFALTSGFLSHLSVSNSLMNMYSKSDEFGQALTIFNSLDNPDIVSWNTVLSGFENVGDALGFACQMHSLGVVFEAVTYTAALAHCTDHEEFCFGTQLHCHVLKFGLESEIFIGNALITLYSKWSRIVEAETVFYEMPKRDLVSWNAVVSGYSQEGSFGLKAMWAFKEMTREDMKLDHVSLTSVVSACGQERDLKLGRQVHGLAIKMGYRLHVSVCNCLMTLYSRCDVVNDAKLVFESMVDRNVISWTTMLSINEEDAMILFNKMRVDGVYPNEVTFVGLIHAITIKNMVKEGLMVHGFCIKTSFFPKLVVANSFITMYAKFEFMKDSMKVFEELDYREIISWNALISGYAQNGLCQEALQTFLAARMELQPNQYSFGSVLSAIGAAESISLKQGQWNPTENGLQ
ncbi:hypothetical protein RJ639_039216 [Escallonia herrerae]|uniref:Pentatricopeptide repeat-containing protein n=1 Tax=Escallonia herrerae TaxID=1293975 RepID=A0AA89B9A1_9ASTE|nr:hypothetical protein RJ639_039216 [Escallonia herrerae]